MCCAFFPSLFQCQSFWPVYLLQTWEIRKGRAVLISEGQEGAGGLTRVPGGASRGAGAGQDHMVVVTIQLGQTVPRAQKLLQWVRPEVLVL